MRSIATLILFTLTALSVSSQSSFADEPKGDLAKLQGSWTAEVGVNVQRTMTATIKGNTIELVFSGPNIEPSKLSGEMTIDEKASPKAFDWVKIVGQRGNEMPSNLGIYKLDGDTWTICAGGANQTRPTEFKAGENRPPRVTSFTRVKEKADEKPIKGDLAKFQGSWTASAGDNDELTITLTVKVNAYTATWDSDGAKVELMGELRMNDQAKPYKTIDFFNTKRNDGENAQDSLGIYEFDGDKIKLCVGGGGDERPTEFKKGDGATPHLLVFTKKKE